MQFTTHKRRSTPNVIIVSLIDVLIVVLIFLIVTTTFKQQAAVKLTLPESKQKKTGQNETNQVVIVTITKSGPLYFKTQPVTLEKLQEKLAEAARENPQTVLAIRADTDAPFGQVIKVKDAAEAANIKTVSAFTQKPKQ